MAKLEKKKGYPNLKRDEYPRVLTCIFLLEGGWVPLTYKNCEYIIMSLFSTLTPLMDFIRKMKKILKLRNFKYCIPFEMKFNVE